MPFRPPTLRPASPETLALAGLWASALDLGLALLLILVAIAAWAPPQDLPWTPLRLAQPVGMATALKFQRAAADPAACRAVLIAGGVTFTEVADRDTGGCATTDTLRLRSGATALSPAGPVITCPVALAYAFWTRHEVQPAARELLGSPVARIEHYGTYACRNVYGRTEGRRSQHAFANALDVAGFTTASGRRVSVAGGFRDEGPKGQFLRQVRDGACPWFRAVLSPDYNAAHRDHFHLDFGRYGLCR